MYLIRSVLQLLFLTAMLAGCGGKSTNLISSSGDERQTVVLLHGLGRSTRAMAYLQYRLQEAGYETFSIGYPSTRLQPEEILQLLRNKVHACCASRKKVHFVGHSLGGVIVRALLQERRDINLGRVVILGSPNQGTALVDWLADNRWFRVLAGPTGMRLGRGNNSWPKQLPAPDYELGVIAGTHSANPIGSWILSGPDDGIVSVQSARLTGMKDFMLTPAGHVMMRYSDEVADAVIQFLQSGSFPHELESRTGERYGMEGME